jgi:hypothetical protein
VRVDNQELRVLMLPGQPPAARVITTFENGEYSVSPPVDSLPDESWSSFIERTFDRVDYQLSLW